MLPCICVLSAQLSYLSSSGLSLCCLQAPGGACLVVTALSTLALCRLADQQDELQDLLKHLDLK